MKKTIAFPKYIGYILCLSEITDKEGVGQIIMARSAELPFEDSIAQTLGVLKERKARGTTLIRVLEDYSRFRCDSKPMHRALRSVNTDAAIPKQELERLYLRRAAVDEVIRSIEAYSKTRLSA